MKGEVSDSAINRWLKKVG